MNKLLNKIFKWDTVLNIILISWLIVAVPYVVTGYKIVDTFTMGIMFIVFFITWGYDLIFNIKLLLLIKKIKKD